MTPPFFPNDPNGPHISIQAIQEQAFYRRRFEPAQEAAIDPNFIDYVLDNTIQVQKSEQTVQVYCDIRSYYRSELPFEYAPDSSKIVVPDETRLPLLVYEAVITFYVAPIETIIVTVEEQEALDPDFLKFLFRESTSILRGIIFAKNQDSYLGAKPLPFVSN